MEPDNPIKRKAAFGQTLKAVLWSFFGVRRGADSAKDVELNPLHVVIAAVLAAAIFVGVLILIVHSVVK